ncbi:trimeric intracellular cation channel family protein [Adhaeribacter terreus]|uniref:Trimeric intracellular cation channel family protein n=1 Tax=Adhaeribacter terreus TaxID=529703 RepID=A0ABW0E7V0_9BACT
MRFPEILILFREFHFVDIVLYIGIFVFAITGALKARAHQMDIFGAGVLAFATAYGGGTLRDLLIGIKINWMNDQLALGLVISAVIIVFLLRRNKAEFNRSLFFTDAIGLGMFTIAGIERSLANGVNEIYAVLMGVMSATFGGLLADIISNHVPALLKKGELYATVCLIGGTVYILLARLQLNDDLNMLICVILVVLLRIISKWKRIFLPEI